MLVLTRKSGQEIVIDGGIRVTILEVQGNRVRVGITAPDEVKVVRKEIEERTLECTASELTHQRGNDREALPPLART